MRVTYTGPIDAVELPQTGAVVKRGDTVDVPDDLGKSLVEQSCWEQEKPKAKVAQPVTPKED